MIKSVAKQTKVSVVIPAYNEEVLLPNTLDSLHKQDYTGPFEIVVCDNNSSDRTAEIAREHGAVLVKEKRKGTSFAYDTGMRKSKGDLILVTNADTLLPPNWISSIVEAYDEDPELVAVGTAVKFYNAPDWINILWKSADAINPIKAMWGASMSCRRWAFDKVGGFKKGHNTNEDALFTLEIKKYGKFRILNDVVVEMDGRRFNQGFLEAVKAWKNGFGLNALYIIINYTLFKQIKGRIKDFEDIRDIKD